MNQRAIKQVKGTLRRSIWSLLAPARYALWGHRRAFAPRRILLLNATHLGDVVVSTGILAVLKNAFPDAEIGYVAGSWTLPILKNHPLVNHIHCIDMPYRNRSAASAEEKRRRYRTQRAQAMDEIKRIGYDWAISLNIWRPDFLDLAFLCGIPVRAAYRRHLLSLLATHVAASPEKSYLRTEGMCQAELLRALGIGEEQLRLRHMSLAPSSAEAMAEVDALIGAGAAGGAGYFVAHMGAGALAREMPVEFWRRLVAQLPGNALVVFTGQGEREARNIEQVIEGLPCCINAANRLSWNGVVATVRRARAVFSVDTSICHVAAAVDTPLIAFYTGITGVGRWRAEGKSVCIWTNHVVCSPCGRADGCKEMTCLRGIRPEDAAQSLEWITGAQETLSTGKQ